MALTLVTQPAVEPVSLAEAKAHLRVDGPDEDGLITALIAAARQAAEAYTRRAFITQTWRLTLDKFPGKAVPWWNGVRQGADIAAPGDFITLPRPPLRSVTSLKAYDDADNATTMAASDYYVDTDSEPGRVVLRSGKTWPAVERVANGVDIVFTAGYGGQAVDVPQAIREGILLHIAAMFEHRGDERMPALSESLYRPSRVAVL